MIRICSYPLVSSFILLAFSIIQPVFSQDAVLLHRDTFDEGVPSNWNVFSSGATAAWSWTSDGKADSDSSAYWADRPAISAVSGSGAMVFDADSLSEVGVSGPHIASLEGSFFIDGYTGGPVYLKFTQYFRSHDAFTVVEHIDLYGNSQFYEINELIHTNVETSNKETIVLELPSPPLSEPFFHLRFIFEGSYYFWLIDDVEIYEGKPCPQTFPKYLGDSLKVFGIPFDVACDKSPHVPDQLVVHFAPGISDTAKSAQRDTFGVTSFEQCAGKPQLELWTLGGPLIPPTNMLSPSGPSTGINNLISKGKSSNEIDEVDVNRYLWDELRKGAENLFQPLSLPPANVAHTSNEDIIMAVLDTGIDYNHPLLRGKAWRKDNSDNAYDNDFVGWNFVKGNNNPNDDQGHGSHAAGIIVQALEKNCNSANTKIIALKTHDHHGVGELFNASCAMYYGIEQEARVFNLSWGWYGDTSGVFDLIIDSVAAHNALIFAAVGNDSLDFSEGYRQYPACSDSDAVIAVASIDSMNNKVVLSPFSNHSSQYTDLGAPGDSILSAAPTWAPDSLTHKSGTSMSAPAAAAGAACLLACPNIDFSDYRTLRKVLLEFSIENTSLNNEISEGRILAFPDCMTVGIERPIASENLFSVYPNPASHTLHLVSLTSLALQTEVTLHNVLGQQLRSIVTGPLMKEQIISIDLSGLSGGFYVLSVRHEEEIQSVKILKR